jgi:hypothetical protein
MNFSTTKRYQLVLWETETREGLAPALRLEFDTAEAALQAFEDKRAQGSYRTGVLIQWHKHAGDWTLLKRFPS